MKKIILAGLIALMTLAPIYAFAGGCSGASGCEKGKCTCQSCKCGSGGPCTCGCCGK